MLYPLSATSQSVDVAVYDDTGLAVTGLLAATFPTLTYDLAGPNADVAFPALSDLAALTTAYASGGLKERGNGIYRLDVPNGVFTTAGKVTIKADATGKHMLPVLIEVQPAVTLDLSQALPAAPVANSVGEAMFILDNLAGRIATAQAGAASTITLDAGASSIDGRYVGYGCYLYGGTGGGIRGVGQERTITAYNGTTKVATVAQPWGTNPDNTSKFMLYVQPWTNVGLWNGTAVLTPTTAGVPEVDLSTIKGQSVTCAAGVTFLASVGTAATSTAQTGDSFALIGSTGSGLTSLAPSATALSTANYTSARAGYLDNLNVGGVVASHADILAINQSASKHLLLVTVGQFEPGETYTVEMRTFNAATGGAVNADTTPTLTATGNVSGDLSGNLSAATNPATGVYRWTYTPGATPTLEQIRFDGSATISSATFTLSAYSQTVDFATAVFTATDQAHLTSIFNKLPTNNIADETVVLSAIGTPAQAATALSTAQWTNSLATNLGTLAGHDPGSTLASHADIAALNNITAASVWSVGARTLTAATNITSDGATISQTQLAHLDVDVTSRASATVAPSWYTTPVGADVNVTAINGSTAAAAINALIAAGLETGTARGGSATAITLRSGASSEDSIFVNQAVYIFAGTGEGQTNKGTTYDGSSKVLGVETPWVIDPDDTSEYVVLGRIG